MCSKTSAAKARETHDLTGLSTREKQIMSLNADGLTNRELGLRLSLAEKTIKNYVSGLLSKLGLQRRTQAAAFHMETHPRETALDRTRLMAETLGDDEVELVQPVGRVGRIVVGVDGSEASVAALQHSIWLANATNNSVIAVSSWRLPNGFARPFRGVVNIT
jgi:DNA-binding CsgD family transcriptional regulator